jgi:uncharacterized protein (DUF2384 family)
MTQFQLALLALEWAIASADATAKARAVYNAIAEQAKRDHAFTPEESAALDAKAAEIFGSEASKPSGR